MVTNLLKIGKLTGRIWCAVMHDDITWPIHGAYRCRKCWRDYTVAWGRSDVRFNRAATVKRAIQSNGAASPSRPVSEGNVGPNPQTTAACPA